MSLVAPQDNTLVMYCNRNAALSDRTFVLRVWTLFLSWPRRSQNPFRRAEVGTCLAPSSPAQPQWHFWRRTDRLQGAARVIRVVGGKQGELLSYTVPPEQKTSLPLGQQNMPDQLFNNKLSPWIKGGKEKGCFLPFTLRKRCLQNLKRKEICYMPIVIQYWWTLRLLTLVQGQPLPLLCCFDSLGYYAQPLSRCYLKKKKAISSCIWSTGINSSVQL